MGRTNVTLIPPLDQCLPPINIAMIFFFPGYFCQFVVQGRPVPYRLVPYILDTSGDPWG